MNPKTTLAIAAAIAAAGMASNAVLVGAGRGATRQPLQPRAPEPMGPPKPEHTNARQTARYARQMARDKANQERKRRRALEAAGFVFADVVLKAKP
ncbi:MAG TPA: hypothetical protein VJQ42_02095 [Rhodanobacteraceae bacterium]|nr:hypothetical protein [Rhodanobacteraceae bacterium]